MNILVDMILHLIISQFSVFPFSVSTLFAGSLSRRTSVGKITELEGISLTKDRDSEDNLWPLGADLLDPFTRVLYDETQGARMKDRVLRFLARGTRRNVWPAFQGYQIDERYKFGIHWIIRFQGDRESVSFLG